MKIYLLDDEDLEFAAMAYCEKQPSVLRLSRFPFILVRAMREMRSRLRESLDSGDTSVVLSWAIEEGDGQVTRHKSASRGAVQVSLWYETSSEGVVKELVSFGRTFTSVAGHGVALMLTREEEEISAKE